MSRDANAKRDAQIRALVPRIGRAETAQRLKLSIGTIHGVMWRASAGAAAARERPKPPRKPREAAKRPPAPKPVAIAASRPVPAPKPAVPIVPAYDPITGHHGYTQLVICQAIIDARPRFVEVKRRGVW